MRVLGRSSYCSTALRSPHSPFLAAVSPRGADGVDLSECELNGQPAMVVCRDGRAATAILIATDGERIRALFMHADPDRLTTVPPTRR